MGKIRVSAVKYINSIPFIIGLQEHVVNREIELSLDTPSECYKKLSEGIADVGLVPVVFLSVNPLSKMITDFCIGSDHEVMTVILVSMQTPDTIQTLYLDYQSKTSVYLTRLLCRDFWKINPVFKALTPENEYEVIKDGEARLVIGDRAFRYHLDKNYQITDLSAEWRRMTGLPFVFAVWAAVKPLSPAFTELFSEALAYGLKQKEQLSMELNASGRFPGIDMKSYLTGNILHEIHPAMREGMNLFLHLIRNIHT